MIRVPSCGHWCCAYPFSPPVAEPTCRLNLPAHHPDHIDQHADEELGTPGDCPACDGAHDFLEGP